MKQFDLIFFKCLNFGDNSVSQVKSINSFNIILFSEVSSPRICLEVDKEMCLQQVVSELRRKVFEIYKSQESQKTL